MKSSSLLPLAFALFTVALVPAAQAADPAADNSGNNVTDRQPEAVTPEKQSNEKADVEVTRAIRRAVVKDSALSVYAHNIKIITTTEHVVYLRGAVSSTDDLGKIVALAEKNANGYPVKNQLSVTTK